MIRSRLGYVLLGALTAFVFLLLYGPIFLPIVSSLFVVKAGVVHWDQPTLAAYAALARDEGILEALRNTAIVGGAGGGAPAARPAPPAPGG
ncbi:MAG: hypothetical protein IRY94_21360 [Rhodospirillaceae bacterium]|nr:hypothetical protein [Rhodospirillaceae bacterium]